jgi:hypothetical protein
MCITELCIGGKGRTGRRGRGRRKVSVCTRNGCLKLQMRSPRHKRLREKWGSVLTWGPGKPPGQQFDTAWSNQAEFQTVLVVVAFTQEQREASAYFKQKQPDQIPTCVHGVDGSHMGTGASTEGYLGEGVVWGLRENMRQRHRSAMPCM